MKFKPELLRNTLTNGTEFKTITKMKKYASLKERRKGVSMKKLFTVLVLGMLAATAVSAGNLEKIGEWGAPAYNRVVKIQNMAYMLSESGFLDVLNITDSANPQFITRLHFDGKPKFLLADGDIAYLSAGWGGIYTLDVSDPANPIVKNHLEIAADVREMSKTDGYLYAVVGLQGIEIIDISDPFTPVVDHAYGIEEEVLGKTKSVLLDGDHAFVGDDRKGLVVLDTTDPTAPSPTVALSLGTSVYGMAKCGNTLVLSLGAAGIFTVDVTDPAAPVFGIKLSSGSVDLDGDGTDDVTFNISYAYQIFPLGNQAIVADGDNGFDIVNVEDPAAPVLQMQVATPSPTTGAIAEGNTVYLAETLNGLGIYDISDTVNPVLLGSYQESGNIRDISVSGNTMFVSDPYLGIRVLDIENHTAPVYITNAVDAGAPMAAVAEGTRLYAADLFQGLTVYDITDPTNTTLASSLALPGVSLNLTSWDGGLLVSDEWEGISVVSLDDPDTPVLTGTFTASGYVYSASADGNEAALAAGFSGLEMVSLADPANPVFESGFNTDGLVNAVLLQNGIAYVGDMFAGLFIIDVHNPAVPQLLSQLPDETGISDMKISDGILYAARGAHGLDKLDVHTPDAPIVLENIPTFGSFGKAQLDLPFVYVADKTSGQIVILKENASTKLAIPHIAEGSGWRTEITLKNQSDTNGIAILTTYRDTVPVFSRRLNIPASGSLTVNQLPGNCGTVEILSSGLEVTEVITQIKSGEQASFPLVPLQPGEIVIPVPENTNVAWEGLALMNGGDGNRQLTVKAWNANGILLGTKAVVLGEQYRKTWLLDSMFPGVSQKDIRTVTVSSETAASGLLISGKEDGSMEAVIGKN